MSLREEFEAAFSKKTASLPIPKGEEKLEDFEQVLLEVMVRDRAGKTYGQNIFATAWWAWQASREALVVELPEAVPPDYCGQELVITLAGVQTAMEAAGLKVQQ